ncbi:uncharacterized protein LOC131635887 [Vicia villosa]|uniref:uncharacterized protein LOC131635887 n=1 Tax=Vicia villosa TaxID=3911 RepID=UPI00273A9A8B|nr:uncharacterized protein LOC131635887 [Vicia villosa]
MTSNSKFLMVTESVRRGLEGKCENQASSLVAESKLYELLLLGTGIPIAKWSGVEGEYNVLVMDLLGPSLEDLFNLCKRKLSLNTNEARTRYEYRIRHVSDTAIR